jgi:glyoxylase-like metal-dependent hydrolase (beta-lactamase superfamily II)
MQVQLIADPAYDSNMFLIASETPILIDTGTGLSPESCIQSISKFIEVRSIDRIVLTHRHIDHVGGAKPLSEACEAVLYASRDETPSLLSGDQGTTAASMFGKRLEKLDVKAIDYGEDIKIGQEKLNVIHTPGHTKGSICLYEESTKSLFSGDTVFSHGGVGRWDFPTGNLDQLIESVRKLSKIPVENLYPGHGPIVQSNAYLHIEASLRSLNVYKLV